MISVYEHLAVTSDHRPAYLLGSGPSLRHLEPERLKGCVIACNSAILKAPSADYYFATDGGVSYFGSFDMLNDLACKIVLGSRCAHFAYNMGRCKTPTDRIIRLPYERHGYDLSQPKLIVGLSCVHVAAHFAWLLGCSPLVLIGCDCATEEGKVWAWEFEGETTETIHPNHPGFIGREGEKKYLGGFSTGWERIKAQTPHELPILNASGGTYDTWPRISLEDAYGLG